MDSQRVDKTEHALPGKRPEKHKGKKVPHKVFSPWALIQLGRVWRAQGALRETCQECGFKIRGPNHAAGTHHKLRHPTMRAAAAAKAGGL